ncbi:antibiotic biosynthesis monooxygenase family protein [Acuticoccus mangrovi]|uniref:Antibiotic biosynthesis monooxygenase n=1 Tax=Acuticoccus mangrovi TaxID=2796142 RepID=A0A934IF69_9HYPH|nr:antibiotic biosynthesis monooxygenase [Acuticoccus mangrovi]MBJ3775519.1 antibiotic biosynthesis monooxygenase [Acuticoccus mangrovi]
MSPVPSTADGPVTLINVFEVPDGRLAETVDAWHAARDFLVEQPGYISTELHEALGADARFSLVNVARWQSTGCFRAAMEKMQAAGVFRPAEGLRFTPALYRTRFTDAAPR